MIRSLLYFLPESGESLKDARALPAQWDSADHECFDDYSENVARYLHSLDPQNVDFTVTVVGGGCCATFEVQGEYVLTFSPVEVSG